MIWLTDETMIKIVLTLLGLVVGIALGYSLHDTYKHTQYHQINACIDMYMSNINPNEPEIQEAMRTQGFKTVKALVQEHCRWYVVDSSQTFDQ